MTRIAIDHDADGAFAVITRPGQAAERVELTHRDAVRLMSEAAQVVLVEERRRKMTLVRTDGHSEAPPHFIGALGE
ncbi:hypothetical protein [Xanthobacter versatilis]|uniref:hypothetical protein n=1 Tax=Xanthobacter autotrophicus (strain ATCC BAA-1158 / Py2) TaxID=78245 RepID=UPI003726F880